MRLKKASAWNWIWSTKSWALFCYYLFIPVYPALFSLPLFSWPWSPFHGRPHRPWPIALQAHSSPRPIVCSWTRLETTKDFQEFDHVVFSNSNHVGFNNLTTWCFKIQAMWVLFFILTFDPVLLHAVNLLFGRLSFGFESGLDFGELGAPQVGLDGQPQLPPHPSLAHQKVADGSLNAVKGHL